MYTIETAIETNTHSHSAHAYTHIYVPYIYIPRVTMWIFVIPHIYQVICFHSICVCLIHSVSSSLSRLCLTFFLLLTLVFYRVVSFLPVVHIEYIYCIAIFLQHIYSQFCFRFCISSLISLSFTFYHNSEFSNANTHTNTYLLYTQLNISQVFTECDRQEFALLFFIRFLVHTVGFHHSRSLSLSHTFTLFPLHSPLFKVMSFVCILKSESLTNLFTLRTISSVFVVYCVAQNSKQQSKQRRC